MNTPRAHAASIPDQPFHSARDLYEDIMARRGFAIVSRATMDVIERIERSPSTATAEDFAAVRYAVYSGPAGLYWPRPEPLEPVDVEEFV